MLATKTCGGRRRRATRRKSVRRKSVRGGVSYKKQSKKVKKCPKCKKTKKAKYLRKKGGTYSQSSSDLDPENYTEYANANADNNNADA